MEKSIQEFYNKFKNYEEVIEKNREKLERDSKNPNEKEFINTLSYKQGDRKYDSRSND